MNGDISVDIEPIHRTTGHKSAARPALSDHVILVGASIVLYPPTKAADLWHYIKWSFFIKAPSMAKYEYH
jgi:hypothetical protein